MFCTNNNLTSLKTDGTNSILFVPHFNQHTTTDVSILTALQTYLYRKTLTYSVQICWVPYKHDIVYCVQFWGKSYYSVYLISTSTSQLMNVFTHSCNSAIIGLLHVWQKCIVFPTKCKWYGKDDLFFWVWVFWGVFFFVGGWGFGKVFFFIPTSAPQHIYITFLWISVCKKFLSYIAEMSWISLQDY